jgi:hypothetical protein
METFYTFTVQVFKNFTPAGKLTEYVEVIVIADNEEKAIKKAKKICPRDGFEYRIKLVTEYERTSDNK